jgi:hypothetical protein
VRFFLEETAGVGEAFTFFNRSQEILEFAGGKVSLGWVTEIDHSAKLDNLGELTTWYDTGRDGRIEVRLALANNNQMTVRLSGAHEETDIDPPHRSHPELTSHSQQRPQCERIVATTATDRDVNRHPVTTTEEARLAAAAPGVGNRYT